jgi:serine O-acetyltransferase
MQNIIKADLYRIVPKPYSFFVLLNGLRNKGFRYMFLLRNVSSAKNIFSKIFFRLLMRHYTYKYGYQIPYNTHIGRGFYIGHMGSIVINEKAVIGENCNITHGVTIGVANRGKLKGTPTLGDFVWIGTNAVIVGNITIGSHVLIAPGSFVNFDVPSYSMVIGNPGKIIAKENPTDGYINNISE